jgi:hypothetical protein
MMGAIVTMSLANIPSRRIRTKSGLSAWRKVPGTLHVVMCCRPLGVPGTKKEEEEEEEE